MDPNFTKLIHHIQEVVDLGEDDASKIIETFKLKRFDKKEILLHQGDVSQHMRFIVQGCIRSYYLNEREQERVLQFAIEGWWINDLYSFLTQTPARSTLQAIEPSMVLLIHRDSLKRLFQQIPVMERFFRLKIQSAYVALQERTMFNMSHSAEERYLNFRDKYRNIEQRVPQYMVASYLGITPEFLSSIRKNLAAN